MTKPKTINPLQQPLKNLCKHAERILSIPGFDSETLQKSIAEARKAIGTKTKTKT